MPQGLGSCLRDIVLYSAGYSLFNVPYRALPAELTDGYHERTRLSSFRTVFVSFGQLLDLSIIGYGGEGLLAT